jgi:hypothetical protein
MSFRLGDKLATFRVFVQSPIPNLSRAQEVIRPLENAQPMGNWAGAPTVAAIRLGGETWFALAWRDRKPLNPAERDQTRGVGTRVIMARTPQLLKALSGEQRGRALTLSRPDDAQSVERPALFQTSDALVHVITCNARRDDLPLPWSKDWWNLEHTFRPEDLLAGGGDLSKVRPFQIREVFADLVERNGDNSPREAFKDPVVKQVGERLHAMVTSHRLTVAGHEEHMKTAHFVSTDDGKTWQRRADILLPKDGTFYAHGARITDFEVSPKTGRVMVFFDGRPTTGTTDKREITGVAFGDLEHGLVAVATPAAYVEGSDPSVRYLTSVRHHGRTHCWFERANPDGSHSTFHFSRPSPHLFNVPQAFKRAFAAKGVKDIWPDLDAGGSSKTV